MILCRSLMVFPGINLAANTSSKAWNTFCLISRRSQTVICLFPCQFLYREICGEMDEFYRARFIRLLADSVGRKI